MSAKVRLAYLVTHPIQYQAPLLRRIAQEPDIDLTVFFCSDLSVREYNDTGFGSAVKWDVPLLEGYRYEFLPALGRTDGISFWRPFNHGLARRLEAGEFDALWVHGYARWMHWLAIFTARRYGMKVLLRDEATMISTNRSYPKQIAKRVFFILLDRLCDSFLAIGHLNAEYYRHHGIPSDKISFMPYAVDNRFFKEKAMEASRTREDLRSALGCDPGRPIVLYASKMTGRKRAVDLLEAYARLSPDGTSEPRPYLVLIGDGSMRPALERRAAELGWHSILFLGFRNQTELPRYYDLCDVFVLPSIHEPWGLVVNEVMNARKAVIVSDQVGCGADLVHHDSNGYVFPAGDVDALADALRQALDAGSRRAAIMGERSGEIIAGWDFEADVAGLRHGLGLALRASS